MPLGIDSIQTIVIVGGGAAGWLTANHLAREFQSESLPNVKITLIESPNIPTIGVGEGTVPSIRDSLQHFGISETDLIQRCNASFKQSIEFVGWQPDDISGQQHRYQHIFDYPRCKHPTAIHDWLHKGYQSANFSDTFSIQSHFIAKGLGPKRFTQAEYQGLCSYAYHFDAGKFSELLAENAVQRLGVIHKRTEITAILGDQQDGIASLLTLEQERIEADLFIDCSGARSLLLGDFLKVPFVAKNHMLFTDTALATQIPNTSANASVPCSTIATAHKAGWIWDIGLSNRRGVGIVYSSSHMSDIDAEVELNNYIGSASFESTRKIPMRAGYYEQFWQANCVAIGMSQGFVEPLEATGLLMYDKSAQLLAQTLKNLNSDVDDIHTAMQRQANHFNTTLRGVWDSVFDFIKLHYCISQRQDSQFWLDHQDPNTCSANLREYLRLWQHQLPKESSFSTSPSVFNLNNYLYVLLGMGFKPNSEHVDWVTEDHSSQMHLSVMQQLTGELSPGLLNHRALLDQIQAHGLQKI